MNLPFNGIDSKYDLNKVYSLYTKEKKSENNYLLLESLLPIIEIVINSCFANVSDDIKDDMVGESTEKLISLINGERIKFSTPKDLHNFLYTVIKNVCLRTIKKLSSQVFDFYSMCLSYYTDIAGKVPLVRDVNIHLYLSQFKNQLREYVLNRIRFFGNEWNACVYILNCYLDNEKPSDYIVRKVFGVKNSKFYIDYVKVLCRRGVYEIAEKNFKDGIDIYEDIGMNVIVDGEESVKEVSYLDGEFENVENMT